MALVTVAKCPTCGREHGERHRVVGKAPSVSTLERMVSRGVGKATDGCGGIELDSECEHGHQSWLRFLGWI